MQNLYFIVGKINILHKNAYNLKVCALSILSTQRREVFILTRRSLHENDVHSAGLDALVLRGRTTLYRADERNSLLCATTCKNLRNNSRRRDT